MPQIRYQHRVPHRWGWDPHSLVTEVLAQPEIRMAHSMCQNHQVDCQDRGDHTWLDIKFELAESDLAWLILQFPQGTVTVEDSDIHK